MEHMTIYLLALNKYWNDILFGLWFWISVSVKFWHLLWVPNSFRQCALTWHPDRHHGDQKVALTFYNRWNGDSMHMIKFWCEHLSMSTIESVLALCLACYWFSNLHVCSNLQRQNSSVLGMLIALYVNFSKTTESHSSTEISFWPLHFHF